jgi:hypothetical protein
MATVLDKTKSRQRISEIRQLWTDWNPIGVVSGTGPDDEYDAYLAPTLRLLERDASVDEIVAYLKWVTLEHMGLSEVAGPEVFAERLRQWFKSKWEGTRVPGA